MPSRAVGDTQPDGVLPLQAKVLGPFLITLGDKSGGPWRRPTGRRLCELLLLSPGRRISRERACGALFPGLTPTRAARALSKALSLGREALSELGAPGRELLCANHTHVWANPTYPLEVDLDRHQEDIRLAVEAEPGALRDRLLEEALANQGVLLEDEPLAEWAVHPRERLEWARQEARLALARDRARGLGCSGPGAVEQAWEACLSHDPTSEEAACALMRLYAAQTRWAHVEATYSACRLALGQLGLRASPALEEVHAASSPSTTSLYGAGDFWVPSRFDRDREQRVVTCLFVELSGPLAAGSSLAPEDLSERVGSALAEVVAHVEAYGGTVTAVSGAGLVALFGAPVARRR